LRGRQYIGACGFNAGNVVVHGRPSKRVVESRTTLFTLGSPPRIKQRCELTLGLNKRFFSGRRHNFGGLRPLGKTDQGNLGVDLGSMHQDRTLRIEKAAGQTALNGCDMRQLAGVVLKQRLGVANGVQKVRVGTPERLKETRYLGRWGRRDTSKVVLLQCRLHGGAQ
jgi:hypothetical protein